MKKIYLYATLVIVFLCIVWACTNKEINLITNVELAFEQTNTETGFVQESLPTTITITPEAFLPEFEYYFRYEILDGQGDFTDQNGDTIPEGELIPLSKEQEDTNFFLNLHYNPTTPGAHRVQVTASDNFEKSFSTVLNYNIKNLDILWNITTQVTTSPPNTAVPIDVTLQNNSNNPDLTFEWSYRYTSGTGIVQTADGTSLLSNNPTPITPGRYLFNAFVNEEGTNTIMFEIEDSTGQIITREISFDVAIDALSDNTRITSFVIDGQEAVINQTNITLTLPQGTDLNNLIPNITIPERSTITPSSGVAQNFNSSISYTVTAENGTTTTTYDVLISIEQVPITSIIASQKQLTLVVNDQATATVSILPENASNPTISWMSDDSTIAEVSNGIITARSVGATTIRVTSQENPSISDSITVEVIAANIPLTSIELTPNRTETTIGETAEFFTILFTPNNATNQNILWTSSDENLATVDSNGIISTLQEGEVSITAASTLDPNITSRATLIINSATIPIETIVATPTTLSLTIGDQATINTTVTPENTTSPNIIWISDDNAIATVTDGVVTAVGEGTTTIRVTSQDDATISDTITVNSAIATIPATAITITAPTTNLIEGEEVQLSINFTPENTTNREITWLSSDETVAKVNDTGLVQTLKSGNATITALLTTDAGIRNQVILNITTETIAVTDIALDTNQTTIAVNQTFQLSPTITPNNATNQTVTWQSSNTAVATVDTNGLVTALVAGNTTITVTTADGNNTATATITVENPVIAVTGISISPTAQTLVLTQSPSVQLTPTITPNNATNQTVTWKSSNTAVATVDTNGLVTALAAGKTIVKAVTADGNNTATATITVENPIIAVTGISISPTAQTLVLTQSPSVQLTPTITPNNATNQTVTWKSSNTAVATVDTNGLVTALAAGKTIVKAVTADGNNTATATITVENPVIAVTGISISPTAQTLVLTQSPSVQLTRTITPNNATNQTVTWKSSNTAVATVDTNGLVTALAAGKTIVKAVTIDGEREATATITVENPTIAVIGVDIEVPTTRKLVQGTTLQLKEIIRPANATDKTVQWSSSNPNIATVSNTGLVKAQSANGEAEITVTTSDGDFRAIGIVNITTDPYMDTTTGIYYGIPGSVVNLNAESLEGESSESGRIIVTDKNEAEIITVNLSGDTIDYGGCEGNADEPVFESHPLTIPNDGELHFEISGSFYEVMFGTWSVRPDGPISLP